MKGKKKSAWQKDCDKFEGADICSGCKVVKPYGTMKAVSQVSFDLLCDECRKKKSKIKLCPYHRDSLGWVDCTENFTGCQVEKARKTKMKKKIKSAKKVKSAKAEKREYVVYEQNDIGNGTMEMVRAKNLKEMLRDYFSFPYATNDDEADIEKRKKSQYDIIYDFEMECAENNNIVMVFDVKAKKVVIQA